MKAEPTGSNGPDRRYARLKRMIGMVTAFVLAISGCVAASATAQANEELQGAAAQTQNTTQVQGTTQQTSQTATQQTGQTDASQYTDAPINTSLSPDDPNEKAPEPIGLNQRFGLGRTGQAKVVALRVDFPDMSFAKDDTLEALQSLIDGSNQKFYPYESLNSYYQRSSYGKLSFTGQAFDYHATRNRSEYATEQELLDEAMKALDATVDFSRFDGNNDGRIDVVYLHFAGPNTGWSSQWWSHEFNSYQGRVYDGKEVCNVTFLHTPSNTVDGAQTIIHETGHALGLVDYYSDPKASHPYGSMDTSDMMNDNVTDQCGFSKWLLGWLDDDHVTRIVVGKQGVTVQRGGAQEHKPSISQAVTSLDYDDMRQQGGIMVISADSALLGANGKFSSYYMLQYDDPVGNQSELQQPALRLYRIQAELNESNAFTHFNRGSDEPHNALIELVNMKQAPGHNGNPNLMQGDHINGSTTPSTNFREAASVGFTGIDIAVTAVNALGATVGISYNDAGRVNPDDFAITDTVMSRGVLNNDTYQLKTSTKVIPVNPASRAYITVDGVRYSAMISVNGDIITLDYSLANGTITPRSTCSFDFPEGTFYTGIRDGQPVPSQAISVPVKPGPEEPLSRGTYQWRGDQSWLVKANQSIFADDQGKQHMVFANGTTLGFATFGNDYTNEPNIQTIDLGNTLNSYDVIRHASLRDGTLEVTLGISGDEQTTTYWIDTTTGKPTAHYTGTQSGNTVLRVGNSVLYVTSYDYTGSTVRLLTPQQDGTVRVSDSKGTAELFETQDGTPAIMPLTGTGKDYATDPVTGKAGRSLLLVAGDALEAKLLALADAAQGTTPAWTYTLVTPTRSFFVPDTVNIMAVTATQSASYVLSMEPENGEPRYFLIRFDAKGTRNARTQIDAPHIYATDHVKQFSLDAAPNGYLALVDRQISADGATFPRIITTLINPDFTSVTQSTGESTLLQSTGWMNGRWVYVAITSHIEDDQPSTLDYSATRVLDTAPSPSPVTPSDPSKPSTPGKGGNGAHNANTATAATGTNTRTSALTRTGAAVPILLAVGLAVAAIVLLAVAKRPMSQRKH